MISLTELAEKYQDDLNLILANNGELWKFRIWAQTGRTKPPDRDGNEIYENIEGQLSISSSALEANLLKIGIVYLNLEFLIPEEPFRVSSEQTAEDLATIQDNQVYFIAKVTDIINGYFQTAGEITDTDGVKYSQKGSIAVGGLVDISPEFGRAVPVTVALELSFVDGGTNALDIKLYIDGEQIPCQSIVPSRSAQLETNVQSGDTAQKHWASSDVFGIDVTFPSTSNTAVKQLICEFLTGNALNMVHFVKVVWGDIVTQNYLMTVTAMNGSAQGASFAGLQMSLGEFTGNLAAANFPSCYSVYAIPVTDSSISAIDILTSTNVCYVNFSLTSGTTTTGISSFTYTDELKVGDYVVCKGSNTIAQITYIDEDEDLYDLTYVEGVILAATEDEDADNIVYIGGAFISVTANGSISAAVKSSDLIDVTTDIEDEEAVYYVYIVALNATLTVLNGVAIQEAE